MVIERIAYKRLRNATRIAALITAIGVSLLIQYGVIYIRGAQPEAYPDVLANQIISIFGAQISSQAISNSVGHGCPYVLVTVYCA